MTGQETRARRVLRSGVSRVGRCHPVPLPCGTNDPTPTTASRRRGRETAHTRSVWVKLPQTSSYFSGRDTERASTHDPNEQVHPAQSCEDTATSAQGAGCGGQQPPVPHALLGLQRPIHPPPAQKPPRPACLPRPGARGRQEPRDSKAGKQVASGQGALGGPEPHPREWRPESRRGGEAGSTPRSPSSQPPHRCWPPGPAPARPAP